MNKIFFYTLIKKADTIYYTLQATGRYKDMFYHKSLNSVILYNNDEILIYNLNTQKLLKLTPTHEAVSNIIEQDFNTIVQTKNEILYFDPNTIELKQIPVNVVVSNALVTATNNSIVLCGRFGISLHKLDHRKFAITSYYLPNYDQLYNEVYQSVVLKNGTVIIKTDKGVFSTSIADIEQYGLQFDDQDNRLFTWILQDKDHKILHTNDTINILQDQSRLNIDVINLYGKGTLKYHYRTAGQKWQQTTSGELLLENIKPDKYYDLEVFVEDDIWKSDVYHFPLYRIPYWYQTGTWKTIFWVSGSLGFFGLLTGIVLLTRLLVNRKNERRRKVTDLELRAIHSQINPHFIFNTLGTALYFINKRDMDSAYVHVNKFSHLLRSYLKSSRDRFITLDDEVEMLKKYIELQQARFEFEYVIHIDNRIAKYQVQIPSLLLQPLVENAINHGLFHKKEGKRLLQIEFSQGDGEDEIICIIEDNGIGRQRAKAYKEESSIKTESYGNKLTQELIDIFASYEHMNISIEYTDKELPETGTKIKLIIRNIQYAT